MIPTAPPGRAFWFVAYAFAVTMLGTTLPTPLYPIYQQRFGFSGLLVTVIFAVYALAVIAGLLLLGNLSDQAGRRALLLPGLGLSALSAVSFLMAQGLTLILVGRVLSGLSAGIFSGTATAALMDLVPDDRRSLAPPVAVAVNIGALGLGAALAGVLAEIASEPLRLPYVVDLGLLIPAAAGILLAPETVRRPPNIHWRPRRLAVPSEVRAVFVRAAAAGFGSFAVAGLFGAVGPVLLATALGLSSHALVGGIILLLFAASAIGQLGVRRLPEPLALPAGCLGLILSVGLVAGAIVTESLSLLIAGAAAGGLGQGLAIGSGLAAISAGTPVQRRGEATSAFFVWLYVGLAVPVVGVGFVIDVVGLRTAGVGFSVIVGALILTVLASLARGTSRDTQ